MNAILPYKYKIELFSKTENKPSKPIQRKSEAENLKIESRFPTRIPDKRPFEAIPKYEEPNKVKHTEGFKKLQRIIDELKKSEKISFFLSNIDKKLYPDYYDKVHEPIDLSMVESRLSSGSYASSYQFALDIRRIWNNAFSYFATNREIYSATLELSVLFENLMKGNEDVQVAEKKVVPEQHVVEKVTKVSAASKVEQPPKPKVVSDKPLGYLEKKELCDNIKRLEPKYLKGVLDIVKECTDMKGEELEFDIDKLPPRVCRELDKYVRQCTSSQPKIHKKEDSKVPVKEAPIPKYEPAKVEEPKGEVYLPEESESESSSTSESEEEVPTGGFTAGFAGEDDFEFNGDNARW